MTVPAEVEAEIARHFAVEHWKVGTIAAQLGVHHDVVRRVLGLLTPQSRPERMPLLIAPYDEFIKETLKKYPRLRSTRILDMLKERGCRFSRSSTACLSRMFVMGKTRFPGLGNTLIGDETVA